MRTFDEIARDIANNDTTMATLQAVNGALRDGFLATVDMIEANRAEVANLEASIVTLYLAITSGAADYSNNQSQMVVFDKIRRNLDAEVHALAKEIGKTFT